MNVKNGGNTTNLTNHLKRKHAEVSGIMKNMQDKEKQQKIQHKYVISNCNKMLQ